MATDDRKLFLGALREVLTAELRSDGFRGSNANYRRFRDPVIQVINIQGSRYGGECCMNLGIHLAFLPTVVGQAPEPGKLTEPECEFRRRLAPDGRQDQWWTYGWDEASAKASAAHLAELYRDRGKPHLDGWLEFPGRFADITVKDLENRRADALLGSTTSVRAALAFARMHVHLNRPDRAREFAEFGLIHLGPATALQPEFERLLSANAGAG
jgi:hypothetical protein